MESSSNDVTGKEILEHLRSIESRISKIENYLDLPATVPDEQSEAAEIISTKKTETDEELEFRIGQMWFAKLGIFVFLVGWLIGNTLPYDGLNQIIPVVIGIVVGLVTISAAIFLKNKLFTFY
jgi:RecA/RadA recombinase